MQNTMEAEFYLVSIISQELIQLVKYRLKKKKKFFGEIHSKQYYQMNKNCIYLPYANTYFGGAESLTYPKVYLYMVCHKHTIVDTKANEIDLNKSQLRSMPFLHNNRNAIRRVLQRGKIIFFLFLSDMRKIYRQQSAIFIQLPSRELQNNCTFLSHFFVEYSYYSCTLHPMKHTTLLSGTQSPVSHRPAITRSIFLSFNGRMSVPLSFRPSGSPAPCQD
ncbi:hypothetical protein PUN28_004494 [Cardiocondyla obscurior]|uniref:Uncharacterized protein n=1 Tax=Cardiocondyla obscurior TaxID=286306 RepID=A0AAW2GDY5_9HYME